MALNISYKTHVWPVRTGHTLTYNNDEWLWNFSGPVCRWVDLWVSCIVLWVLEKFKTTLLVFVLFPKAVPEMRKPPKAKFRILFLWVFTLAIKVFFQQGQGLSLCSLFFCCGYSQYSEFHYPVVVVCRVWEEVLLLFLSKLSVPGSFWGLAASPAFRNTVGFRSLVIPWICGVWAIKLPVIVSLSEMARQDLLIFAKAIETLPQSCYTSEFLLVLYSGWGRRKGLNEQNVLVYQSCLALLP